MKRLSSWYTVLVFCRSMTSPATLYQHLHYLHYSVSIHISPPEALLPTWVQMTRFLSHMLYTTTTGLLGGLCALGSSLAWTIFSITVARSFPMQNLPLWSSLHTKTLTGPKPRRGEYDVLRNRLAAGGGCTASTVSRRRCGRAW